VVNKIGSAVFIHN